MLENIERMTITLPTGMAAIIKGAVEGGNYASSSEVIREALRDWNMKRAAQLREFAALKADLNEGLEDIEAGRIRKFDAKRIASLGRKKLKSRSR